MAAFRCATPLLKTSLAIGNQTFWERNWIYWLFRHAMRARPWN